MCGIVCAFDLKQPSTMLRPQLLTMAKCLRHRGPDWSGIYDDEKAILAHERLAIVDPTSGKQPLISEDKKLVLAANGEIYNHMELRKQFEGKYVFQTKSDCEVILALYKEKGTSFLDDLKGIFGFAIYDVDKDEYFIARDHMGIIPLYIGALLRGTWQCVLPDRARRSEDGWRAQGAVRGQSRDGQVLGPGSSRAARKAPAR